MGFDFERAVNTCNRQIKRFGSSAANPTAAGKLRRGTPAVDRNCVCAIVDFKPNEINLKEIGARRALISALALTTPPDNLLDKLVFNGNVYRIVKPVSGPRPADVVLFYDCEVVYDSRDV